MNENQKGKENRNYGKWHFGHSKWYFKARMWRGKKIAVLVNDILDTVMTFESAHENQKGNACSKAGKKGVFYGIFHMKKHRQ